MGVNMRQCCHLGVMLFLVSFITTLSKADEWLHIETPNFVVYSQDDEATTVEFVKELERYRQFLVQVAGISPQGKALKLTVYIAANKSSYRKLTASKSAGMFNTKRNGPTAIIYQKRKQGRYGQDSLQVLFHEYVHYLQYQGTPAPYPMWYQEGLAEYLSSVRSIKGGMQAGEILLARVPDLYGQDWYHVKKLFEAKKVLKNGYIFYAQSWLMTHMLYSHETFRPGRTRFLELLATGTEPLDALQQVYGMTYSTFDFALREYFKGRKFPAFQFASEEPNFQLSKSRILSVNDGELLDLEIATEFYRKDRDMRRLLKRVRKQAKKAKEKRPYKVFEAQLLADMGNWNDAESIARLLVQEELTNYSHFALAGEFILRNELKRQTSLGEWDLTAPAIVEARNLLEKAVGMNPKNARARRWLAASYVTGENVKQYDAAEQVIREAYALYPQYRPIRNQYAYLMNAKKKFVAACNLFRPLYRTAYGEKEKTQLKKTIEKMPGGLSACPL